METVALAALYALFGWLGVSTAIPPGVASAIWPASGLALAGLVLRGRSLWPGIWLGSLALNTVVLRRAGAPLPSAVAVASAIASGSALQAWLGASLVDRYVGARGAFDRASSVAQFVAIGAASCLVAATLGAIALCGAGSAPWSVFGETWLTWWLGDVVGILVVAPLLLVWTVRESRANPWRTRWVELAFLGTLMLLAAELIFGVPIPRSAPSGPLAYLFLPLVVWAAFRFDLRGGVTAIFLASAAAVAGTMVGKSQFATATGNTALLSAQLFVAVVAVTGLTLGAVLRERRRLDAEKGELLEALARSNEELERFARIASHDLREPLRTVSSHLALLGRKASAKLSEAESQNLRFAQAAAVRMQRLIEVLLEMSKPRTGAERFTAVSCDEVVDAVVAKLRVAIDEVGGRVTSDPLPTVRADAIPLEQVFQNLIGNALKYRAEGTAPVVHVSAERGEKAWIFCVRDNGIGIRPNDRERIFLPFERLHGRASYPGSGLGLSLCRRIVAHHGGKIWVSSEPGRGSEFRFTIPADEAYRSQQEAPRPPHL